MLVARPPLRDLVPSRSGSRLLTWILSFYEISRDTPTRFWCNFFVFICATHWSYPTLINHTSIEEKNDCSRVTTLARGKTIHERSRLEMNKSTRAGISECRRYIHPRVSWWSAEVVNSFLQRTWSYVDCHQPSWLLMNSIHPRRSHMINQRSFITMTWHGVVNKYAWINCGKGWYSTN